MKGILRSAFVAYAYLILGSFLLVSPWTTLWNLTLEPAWLEPFRSVLSTGWCRGLISGLGLLNLFAALREGSVLAKRYREP